MTQGFIHLAGCEWQLTCAITPYTDYNIFVKQKGYKNNNFKLKRSASGTRALILKAQSIKRTMMNIANYITQEKNMKRKSTRSVTGRHKFLIACGENM